MPTYSYRCLDCGYEFDEVQRITDETLVQCPHCLELSLQRVITTTNKPILRGSGWPDKEHR